MIQLIPLEAPGIEERREALEREFRGYVNRAIDRRHPRGTNQRRRRQLPLGGC